jgi:hypothetical protein
VPTPNAWSRFRHWRRTRPFWGGLFLLLSAAELFASANLTLADMQVHFGQEGYLSYVLPVVLILCGLLAWFSPAQRLFYGILGLLTALYSFLGLNLGGFGIGMLLGIVGGALTIAWGPPRKRSTPAVAEPLEETEPVEDAETAETAEPIEVAGSDLPPRSPYVSDPPTEIMPGFDGDESPPSRSNGNGGTGRKLLVITLIPLLVTMAVLAGGVGTPARAADCPDGLPSRAATSAKKDTVRQKTVKKTPATGKPRSSSPKAKSPAKTTPEDDKADPEPSASPSDDGNPLLQGLHDLGAGIGNLLGIGDDPTPTPSASPSPTVTPSPTPTPSPGQSGTPAPPSASAPTKPSASATPSDIPCLGAPVLGKKAAAGDVPAVTMKGGLLEGDLLQMYESTYDGVATLDTADGPIRTLQFSMDKSVTTPFSLTIPEPDGASTVIKSDKLTTDGDVKFYTPRFSGKLFGVIPVTFTPDAPPPLTLPYLWFTDVNITLTFVGCNTLTGFPLTIHEAP